MGKSLQPGGANKQELTALSAGELARLIRQREISAREVMQAYQERIEQVNPQLNAIIQMESGEELLRQADAADAAVARKEAVGPLHGVPMTIKDACQVKGFICSCACSGLAKEKATQDATVVARLRGAGGIILGLTNVPELLLNIESDNLMYGRTNHPLDPTRTAGGSSGGEGAILAAGGSPLGLGTDAGGSIRVPAHYCGIAGLKPSLGRIPKTGSVMGDAAGIFGHISTPGPMARCVDDLALALSVMAGPDGIDPDVPPVPLDDYRQVDLSRLRVAYYTYDGLSPVTPETAQTVERMAQLLRPHVASVDNYRPTILERTYHLVAETIFLGGDGGDSYLRWLEYLNVTQPSRSILEFLEMAKECRFSVTDLRMRLREIDQYKIEMARSFREFDVILCPVVATPAKFHGLGLKEFRDASYAMAYNLTGWPAAVIRAGTSPEGLPIGIQIIAKRWRDDNALAVAHQLARMTSS